MVAAVTVIARANAGASPPFRAEPLLKPEHGDYRKLASRPPSTGMVVPVM